MFVDEASIEIRAGRGGDGALSFRREKYIDHGGPDGGDGGHGGAVVFFVDPATDTLSRFRHERRFAAEDGSRGGGAKKHGKNGADLRIGVPPGTVIFLEKNSGRDEGEFLENPRAEPAVSSATAGVSPDGAAQKRGEADPGEAGVVGRGAKPPSEPKLADLTAPGQEICLARGGVGGFGNWHFKSSTRQTPSFAERGTPGEARALRLELRLVANVGIIGFPSVGKSTLIAAISAARPKIAAYEFTTLVPNLGVAELPGGRTLTVCDLPGLIEGAADGRGLGHDFLRHTARCRVLLHLLDPTRPDPAADYLAIRGELKKYSKDLAKKPEIVALGKADLGEGSELLAGDIEKKVYSKTGQKIEVKILSGATGRGTREILENLWKIVDADREKIAPSPSGGGDGVGVFDKKSGLAEDAAAEPAPSVEMPVFRPAETDPDFFTVREIAPGRWEIDGQKIRLFAAKTPPESGEAMDRLRDICERRGVFREARRAGAAPGDAIFFAGVGDVEIGLA